VLLSTALLSMAVIFAVAIGHRQIATLKVSVSHTAPARVLKDGQLVTFFNGWISNRGTQSETFRIEARTRREATPLTLKGQTSRIVVGPGGNRKLDFVLVTAAPDAPLPVAFVLTDRAGTEIFVAKAQVTPARSR
jgi:hypothetical protein